MSLAATIIARDRAAAFARVRAEEAVRLRVAAERLRAGAAAEDAARRSFARRCLEFSRWLDAMSRARTVTARPEYL